MAGYIIDRTLGIGGSDVAAILGLSRYRSALHTYLEKRKELKGDEVKWNEEGKAFGTRCEAIACQMYTERSGRRIRKPGRTHIHPKFPFIRGNVDRIQWDNTRPTDQVRGVVEAKWLDASQRTVWINEGVPEGYYLQIQHYLLCTGLRWGTFVVVFGGNKLEFFDVDRDEPLILRLLEVEKEFWRRVETGNPPDMSFDELGKKLLTRMYPTQVPGKEMVLDDAEAIAKARRLFALQATVKAREASLLEIEVWLKEKMGDAEKLVVPGLASFTWKSQTARRINVDKLRAGHPDIAAQYTEEQPSRVFRKTLAKLVDISAEPLVEDELLFSAPQAARRFSFDE